jgi:hypothetical protein
MVHSDTDPARVGGNIVDAIRHGAAECFAEEVIHPDFFRLALRPPLPPGVLELTNQFLLLRVDRNHRLLRRQSRSHALVDVNELGVSVGMIASLLGFAVSLQAELLPFEQFADHGAADPMPACCQFRR